MGLQGRFGNFLLASAWLARELAQVSRAISETSEPGAHQHHVDFAGFVQNFADSGKKSCMEAGQIVASLAMASRKKTNCTEPPRRFGEWLRDLRETRGLPLRVVAAAAEMDQAHLSKVELGQRLLTSDQASAIAKFFQLDATEVEARRIVEKFRLEHAGNPAAEQAIHMLHEDPVAYGVGK